MLHLILLRGLAREAQHWLDFPDQLTQTLGDGCTIHRLDFPGCGQYFKQPALTSVAAMTDHARAQLAAIAVQHPRDRIYVMGISMGGMVALDWAQRFPNEVSGVVLINSSAGNQPFWWRLRPGAWPTVARALLSDNHRREALVLKIISSDPTAYTRHLAAWLRIQRARPVTRATIMAMLRAAAQFRPSSNCATPGLVLTSMGDQLVSPRASQAIAHQFNWPLHQHPHAGHDLPMDDPQWAAAHVRDWLATVDARLR